METACYKIRQIGGSLVVTIPQEIVQGRALRVGDYLSFVEGHNGDLRLEVWRSTDGKKRKRKAPKRKTGAKR